ncbi:hypothetical protein BP5796_09615 [Coleophoma crateriformis]|uniref:Uncharacterized protein n=1 Tax=Coleophoma crateriformis TaxID=565419 RepID=A0A3D8QYJ2_9HELO|nr:hypothetical protein BP5796_09615 [Coleophoma crateriformis]
MYNRRRLAIATRNAEGIEAAQGGNTREKINANKVFGEGDLFGIRAIERGYFGGVAQSARKPSSQKKSTRIRPVSIRPTSSAPISPIRGMASSSSKIDARLQKAVAAPQPETPGLDAPKFKPKHRPSPLDLASEQTDVEYGNDDLSTPGHELSPLNLAPLEFEATYLKSLTSSNSDDDWDSPLDLHFSQSHTPVSPLAKSRPQSYIPRLRLPGENDMSLNFDLNLSPHSEGGESFQTAPSRQASKATTILKSPRFQETQRPKSPSSNLSLFPNTSHARNFRAPSPLSTSPTRKLSHANALELDAFPPPPPVPDDSYYENDESPSELNDVYGKGKGVLRNSDVKVKRVSVYQPQRERSESPRSRRARVRSSSIYSFSRSRSRSIETTGHQRSASSGSIARTKDSIRGRHSRNISVEEKRRSRDRDQIHYDPKEHHRNRSGSVQGRAIDFDNPRSNPFMDAHAIFDAAYVSDEVTSVLSDRVSNMKSTSGGGSRVNFTTTNYGSKDQGSIKLDAAPSDSSGIQIARRAQSISGHGSPKKNALQTTIIEVTSRPGSIKTLTPPMSSDKSTFLPSPVREEEGAFF